LNIYAENYKTESVNPQHEIFGEPENYKTNCDNMMMIKTNLKRIINGENPME